MALRCVKSFVHSDYPNNTYQNEENIDLQHRSAVAVASFVDFCVENGIAQPPDKIVKNLCTFLCQDTDQTPTFAYSRKITDGILSFQAAGGSALPKAKDSNGESEKSESEKFKENAKAQLARRGAGQAFRQLSARFGPRLLEVVPNMWQSMAGGLLSACQTGEQMFYHHNPYSLIWRRFS